MDETPNKEVITAETLRETPYQLDDEEILKRIIFLGFRNDRELYERFRQKLIDWLPAGTGASLRGSVVTNARHEDGTPFDSKGIGTSDLDLTLHGKEARAMFKEEEYYIPGLHSKPLCDKDSEIADPELNAFRCELQEMVGRPVNIHATSELILDIRHSLLGQPYFFIIRPEETSTKSDDAQTA